MRFHSSVSSGSDLLNTQQPEQNTFRILSSLNPIHVPDGLCACFMAQKLPRQIQAGAFAVVAVVGNSHDTSYVLPVTTTVLGISQNTTIINSVLFDQIDGPLPAFVGMVACGMQCGPAGTRRCRYSDHLRRAHRTDRH